jgi:hypothetical protein
VPSWAVDTVGVDRATVLTGGSEAGARVALAALPGGAMPADHRAPGIEVRLTREAIDAIEKRLIDLSLKAGAAIGGALDRTGDAGKERGKYLNERNIQVSLESRGIRVARGTEGQTDFAYATFGYGGLLALAQGEPDLEALLPEEFRVATRAMAVEMKALEGGEGIGKPVPADAHAIGALHPLLKQPLLELGLDAGNYIDIDAGASRLDDPHAEPALVHAVGRIYEVDGGTVTGGRALRVSLALDALLAQVLPGGNRFAKKKSNQPLRAGKTRVDVDLGVDAEHGELSLGVSIERMNRKGKLRSVSVEAGWTLDQILRLLIELGSVLDTDDTESTADKPGAGVGLLAPTHLSGTISTELFSLTFANQGKVGEHQVDVASLPLVPDMLGAFLDQKTIDACRLHLTLPSVTELAKEIGAAFSSPDGKFEIAEAALEVRTSDGPSKFYGITLRLSRNYLLKLAHFIPYLGTALTIAEAAKDLLSDPVGTVEGLRYAPEAMYYVLRDIDGVIDTLKDFDIGMALSMSDVSAKDAAMLGRAVDRLKRAGIPTTRDGTKKAKQSEGYTEEEVAWLQSQSDAQLQAAFQFYKEVEAKGLLAGLDLDHPGPPRDIDIEDIRRKQKALAAGYLQFEEAMDGAERTGDRAAADKAQAQFIATVEKYVDAGAKSNASHGVAEDGDENGDSATRTETKPTEPEQELVSVSGLPEVPLDRMREALELFPDGPGSMATEQRDYMIQKYAFLTTEQLGDLLGGGTVSVSTQHGSLQLQMLASERWFVRKVFLHRIDPDGKLRSKDKAAPDQTVEQLQESDARVVQAWRSGMLDNMLTSGVKADKERGKKKGDPKANGKKADPGQKKGDKGKGDQPGEGNLADELMGEDEDWMEGGDESDGHAELDPREVEKEREAQEAAANAEAAAKQAKAEEAESARDAWNPSLAVVEELVQWNGSTLELDGDAVDRLLMKHNDRAIKGDGVARCENIELAVGGNIAAPGHPEVLRYYLHYDLAIETTEITQKRETYMLQYNPSTGSHWEFTGDNEQQARDVRAALKLEPDGSFTVVGDGRIRSGKTTFAILKAEGVPQGDKGLYRVTLFMLLIDVKSRSGKVNVRDENDQIQHLGPGDKVKSYVVVDMTW